MDADDGLHGDLGARDGHCTRRQEDRLQHAEVAFFRDEGPASRVTLRTMQKLFIISQGNSCEENIYV